MRNHAQSCSRFCLMWTWIEKRRPLMLTCSPQRLCGKLCLVSSSIHFCGSLYLLSCFASPFFSCVSQITLCFCDCCVALACFFISYVELCMSVSVTNVLVVRSLRSSHEKWSLQCCVSREEKPTFASLCQFFGRIKGNWMLSTCLLLGLSTMPAHAKIRFIYYFVCGKYDSENNTRLTGVKKQ